MRARLRKRRWRSECVGFRCCAVLFAVCAVRGRERGGACVCKERPTLRRADPAGPHENTTKPFTAASDVRAFSLYSFYLSLSLSLSLSSHLLMPRRRPLIALWCDRRCRPWRPTLMRSTSIIIFYPPLAALRAPPLGGDTGISTRLFSLCHQPVALAGFARAKPLLPRNTFPLRVRGSRAPIQSSVPSRQLARLPSPSLLQEASPPTGGLTRARAGR